MIPVEINDLLSYSFLSALQYAPGGRSAAFIVYKCNAKQNTYDARLWLYADGALRELASLCAGSHFVWLDDAHILISKSRGSFTEYLSLNIADGSAAPFFALPFAAREILPLDDAHFAVLGAIDANDPDAYLSASGEAPKASGKREYDILDEVPFWSNGEGITNKKRVALFLVSTRPWRVQRISNPLENVNTMTVLNGELYFNVRAMDRKIDPRGFQARALNWISGEIRVAAEDAVIGAEQLLAVDGSVWLIGSDHQRYKRNENPWFYRIEPRGKLALIRADEYSSESNTITDCRHGEGAARAAKGGALYTLSTRGGNSQLHRVLPDGTREAVIDRPGSVDNFTVSEDSDEILLIAMFDMKLQELYSYHPGRRELKQLSHFNDDALRGRYVAEPQRLSVRSLGWEIEGWVLLPRGYDPSQRYPAILDIHGGPKTAYGPIFMHEMQVWAGMGYFVFYCNPRGSDGGDNQFMDIRGHYGEIDYQNIMDFTDAVLKAWPQIDTRRVCVAGGSYGGFMTNWIIGHTDRFCCAASQRSVCNWISCYGVSDIGLTFVREETDATPSADPEKMWKQSPLRYAANVRTPTLFLHSDEDYRCPLEQGLQMYTALMDNGVPSRFCLFYGENHDLSRAGKPRNRLRRLEEITRWFETYAREV